MGIMSRSAVLWLLLAACSAIGAGQIRGLPPSAEVASRIEAALHDDPTLANNPITVHVDESQIVLSGTVANRKQRLTANRISEIFGVRLTKKLRGKLAAVVEQIEHGHHVFRVNFKNALLRQYEKFSRFLRNELLSNNLQDFGLRKGLDHLGAVRRKFQIITDRFAGFQAQTLNVHVDFPLLQRLALPITIGTVRHPGIRIQDVRVIRLLEVLMHGGMTVGGWTSQQIHQAVLEAFHLSPGAYGLNQLRYDLRKLKGHGLLQRDGHRYAYRLTTKGVQVALLFLFFHKRLCGPLANSCFHHLPDPNHRPKDKLEAAYHRADKAIQKIVDLLAA